MTKIAKLYAQLSGNPRAPLPFRDFERLLGAFGFIWVRTTGSHRHYKHPRVPRSFPIQPEAKDAKPYQVRQFIDMIEEYGLSINE